MLAINSNLASIPLFVSYYKVSSLQLTATPVVARGKRVGKQFAIDGSGRTWQLSCARIT